MCKPKVPKSQGPIAQAPPPATSAASENQTGPKTPDEVAGEDPALKARRKGRNSLRIPLDAQSGSNATGVNIPRS